VLHQLKIPNERQLQTFQHDVLCLNTQTEACALLAACKQLVSF